jgi:hypothetical protein
VNKINVDQFCQSIRLCSTAAITVEKSLCTECVEQFNQRKDNLLLTMNRLMTYFDDVCQRFDLKPCQSFVQQLQQTIPQVLNSFDAAATCHKIGFCSITSVASHVDLVSFGKHLEDEVESSLCPALGPFQSLCQQFVHGNRKQIETSKINFNIRDLMQIGEGHGKGSDLFSASRLSESMRVARCAACVASCPNVIDVDACSNDRCQCCVDRIDRKKQCATSLSDSVFVALINSCDYCPSKTQCRQYWTDIQTQARTWINECDSKQICVRLGFCNASSLCSNTNLFQKECEQILSEFTQSMSKERQSIEQHLPHTFVQVLPIQHVDDTPPTVDESNSTCILCEYVMKILSDYIHQPSTEQEIEASLHRICEQMPKSLQRQCSDLIENYAPAIVATLVDAFDPSTVCQRLNLCTKQMHVQITHVTRANLAACGVCDYVSTFVKFSLKRDPSDKSLEHALNTVCSHLSNEEQAQCQTLVQLFRPHIRQLQLDLGQNFCQQLPMCQTPEDSEKLTPVKTDTLRQSLIHVPVMKEATPNKNEDEIKHKIINNIDETPQCTVCHYVVSYLDAVLKSNQSEAAIEAALSRVCNILPSKNCSSMNTVQ